MKHKLSAVFASLWICIIICIASYLVYQKYIDKQDLSVYEKVQFRYPITKEIVEEKSLSLHKGKYYQKISRKRVMCSLCPNNCILRPNERGLCKVRVNFDGDLYSLVYGKAIARHLDPIEKKPIYHMLPGSKIYSIATAGCNLACKFCQNWQISQAFPEKEPHINLPPEKIVSEALSVGAKSIAYTYTVSVF